MVVLALERAPAARIPCPPAARAARPYSHGALALSCGSGALPQGTSRRQTHRPGPTISAEAAVGTGLAGEANAQSGSERRGANTRTRPSVAGVRRRDPTHECARLRYATRQASGV